MDVFEIYDCYKVLNTFVQLKTSRLPYINSSYFLVSPRVESRFSKIQDTSIYYQNNPPSTIVKEAPQVNS